MNDVLLRTSIACVLGLADVYLDGHVVGAGRSHRRAARLAPYAME